MKTRNFPAKKLARQIEARIRREWRNVFMNDDSPMPSYPNMSKADLEALEAARNKRTKKVRP